MSKDGLPTTTQASVPIARRDPSASEGAAGRNPSAQGVDSRHPLFRAAWHAVNLLLILAIPLAAYSTAWEYSTRRYLKGFSDAIVPESSSAQGKIEAILNWMAHRPARLEAGADLSAPNRDPTATLNYASLLQVCGTATNAFINLADSTGLPARRLLLLDSHRLTKHVVAEVRIDGRWIVVDPAFRLLLRGADGRLLTREELADPAVFSAATQGIPNYSPDYTYDRTAHIRMARLRFVGTPLRHFLNRLLPGWEDSTAMSLLLERESLATLVLAIILVSFLILLRLSLRWYGENWLGIRISRVRKQLLRARDSFFEPI